MQNMIPTWVNGTLVPREKLDVHLAGWRHKAVSVFLRAETGRILLQRRALEKYHTPGLWANSCCTHPLWNETDAACATRRMEEELGITSLAPAPRGTVEYRAEVGGGMVEHEVVSIFLMECDSEITPMPNPAEVIETRWTTLEALKDGIAQNPERYTPWLRIYLKDHADLIFGSPPDPTV